MKTGSLIVIDGTDGSGKTTQINLLAKHLSEQNIPFETISFPRYEENIYGKLIKDYLEGKFGEINEVDPHLIALGFAGDRILAKPLIENWLSNGKLVIANRYVSSSKAHMGANLPEEKRENFFRWLDELEYINNGIPKEDLTILLTVDPKTGQENTFDKNKPDMHEQNLKHLEEANKIYLTLSKENKNNWEIIDCMADGRMRSIEEINKELLNILQKFY